MEAVSILGAGQVSACGPGLDALREALEGAHPETTALVHRTGSFPVCLADPGDWKSVVPARRARRLDAFSRNSLLAASLCLADAGEEIADPGRVGVVAATGHGPVRTTFSLLDRMIDRGDDFMSPMEFSISVHNAPAAALSSFLGLQGPCLTVTGFHLAWPQALWRAVDWLSGGGVDRVIALAADEVHEVMAYARDRQGSEEPPFPGETYAALLLGRSGEAGARGLLRAPRLVQALDPGDALDPARHALLWGTSPTCDALSTVAAVVSDARPVTIASPDGRGGGALVTIEGGGT
jgi:3-oxoacyl-[acyl-carrier-protein] synthase II